MRSSINGRAVHRHRFWRPADRVARSPAGPRPVPHAARHARRRHPMALRPRGRPQQDFAGRHAERDKRCHAPQRGVLVGELLSGRREAGRTCAGVSAGDGGRGVRRPRVRLRRDLSGGPPRCDRRLPADRLHRGDHPGVRRRARHDVRDDERRRVAEKRHRYVRPKVYAMIRRSKHSAEFCCDHAQTRTIVRGDQALANRFGRRRSLTVVSAPWLSSEPRTHRGCQLPATTNR
jgi:hypothetical protein